MRALAATLLVLAGCATGRDHLEEVSPRFSEVGPRRIAVVVAGEPPRDAQARIDRFGIRYPGPVGPDTRLPGNVAEAHRISADLETGLVNLLRSRGYEAVPVPGAGARVRDLLRPDVADALLVVVYRAASRWPTSEYERTEIRQLGALREEVAHYHYTIEHGLLLLPGAYLLDTRTSLRLWSHSNHGLQSDRVAMDDPVRQLGVVVDRSGEPPSPEDLAPTAVKVVLSTYFDSLPRAPAAAARPLTPERVAELTDDAAVDRWRLYPRLVLDVGAGYARRTQTLRGPAAADVDADAAFGGYWDVEMGLRALGRRWMHGPRVALTRSTANYRRVILERTADSLVFREAVLRSATQIDVGYAVAHTWQPRRPMLLALGVGPAFTIGVFDGDEEDGTHAYLGPVAEAEALWAGGSLLAGPFLRGAWMLDLGGGSAPAFVAGARAAVTF